MMMSPLTFKEIFAATIEVYTAFISCLSCFCACVYLYYTLHTSRCYGMWTFLIMQLCFW